MLKHLLFTFLSISSSQLLLADDCGTLTSCGKHIVNNISSISNRSKQTFRKFKEDREKIKAARTIGSFENYLDRKKILSEIESLEQTNKNSKILEALRNLDSAILIKKSPSKGLDKAAVEEALKNLFGAIEAEVTHSSFDEGLKYFNTKFKSREPRSEIYDNADDPEVRYRYADATMGHCLVKIALRQISDQLSALRIRLNSKTDESAIAGVHEVPQVTAAH